MKTGVLVGGILVFTLVGVLSINNSCADPKGNQSNPVREPITIRIVTCNVQDLWLVGRDRQKRMKALGKKLAELDPDIVGFQEAFIGNDRHALIESFSNSRLKFHKYFPSGVVGSGLLVASAYPIKETFFRRYVNSNPWYKIWEGDWWAGKGVALARIELPNGKGGIDIYNTHAQAGYRKQLYTNDYNEIRNRQMAELADFINATKTENAPVFLLGDMNSGQRSENFETVVKKANLVRVMSTGSGVDHIFAVQDTDYLFEVLGGAVITDYEGLRLSDHNGYLSIIRITPVGNNTATRSFAPLSANRTVASKAVASNIALLP